MGALTLIRVMIRWSGTPNLGFGLGVIVGVTATIGVDWCMIVGDGFKMVSWADEPQEESKMMKHRSASTRRSLLERGIEHVPQQ